MNFILKNNLIKLMALVVVLSVASCDNTDEYFDSLNESPVVLLSTANKVPNTLVSDSVKLSTPSAFYTKDVYLSYLDNNANVETISINSTTNDVFMIQEDTILIDQALELINDKRDSIKLRLFSYNPGFKQLEFTITDQFGIEHTAVLEMFVFPNLIPTVHYDLSIDSDNQFVKFDFGRSFDPDSLYGGEVEYYEVNFNGETIVRDKSTVTVIYSDAQIIYDFSVRVMDNDGEYSYIKSDRITL